MKYEAPEYMMNALETDDILTVSSECKIEKNDNNSGSIFMNASSIFN